MRADIPCFILCTLPNERIHVSGPLLFVSQEVARRLRFELRLAVLETVSLPLTDLLIWHPRRDSNPECELRRLVPYPFGDEGI